MNRRSFLFRSGTAAFAAGTLTTTALSTILISCSKDSEPSGGNPGGGNPKLTANLSSDILTVGSYKSQNNVIVIRTAEGNTASSFVALTSVCTHMACTVGYDASSQKIVCPCHGSQYNLDGSVIMGPAPSALAKYSVKVENNTLTVS